LYDICITYDQEVKYIYGKPSLVRILWFLNRILVPGKVGVHVLITFIYNPSNSLCKIVGQNFGNWVAVVNLFVIQFALALRTAAIYGRSTRISLLIFTLLLGSTLSRIVILSMHPIPNKSRPQSPYGSLCLDFPNKIHAAIFYGPVAFDAILYFMTVFQIYAQSPRYAQTFKKSASLFSILVRDGSIYFLVVAIAMAITVIGFFNRPLLGAFTESDLYITICSIACSRLILSLKRSSCQAVYGGWELSMRQMDDPVHRPEDSLSPIEFGMGPVDSRNRFEETPRPVDMDAWNERLARLASELSIR